MGRGPGDASEGSGGHAGCGAEDSSSSPHRMAASTSSAIHAAAVCPSHLPVCLPRLAVSNTNSVGAPASHARQPALGREVVLTGI